MATEYPLSLVIKAVDKATAPLRAINKRLEKFTAPVRKLNNSFRALSAEAGFPRLAKSLTGVGRAVSSVGSEAASLGLKLAGMATAGALGLYAIVRGAVDAGDKLNEMAQRVGLSVDAYAQLQFAAAQADVEQEAFNSAMDQFNKRLGEAKAGSGPLLSFLNQVAPQLGLAVRGSKSTEAAFRLMTDAFEKVTDPGKRAALAAAAFGKSGLQMGQVLGQGNKALDEQRRRFFELAGSQAEFAAGANDLDNAMREAETGFLGLRTAAAAALFPALTELAKAITGVVSGNRQALAGWAREAGAAITGWVRGGGIQRLVASMKEWADRIDRLIGALGGLKGVATILGVYLASGFIASVGGAVAAIWNLGAALLPMGARFLALLPGLGAATASMWAFTAALLANPITWIVAGVAALVALGVSMYRDWAPTKALLEDIFGLFKKIGSIGDGFRGDDLTEYGPDNQDFGAGRPTLGAAAASAGPAARSGQAHVTVDFANAPRGTRVTPDPASTVPLDLSVGYTMAASH